MKKELPLVSVIIPVYNSAEYLERSIQSILDQTYQNLEIIIIEDCSTDNSLEILQSFDDDRIILIKNEENKGVALTLNRGLDIAKGKYICRHDSDDVSLVNRIQIQVDYLENNKETIVVGSDFNNVFLDGTVNIGYKRNNTLWTIIGSPVHHPTTMYRNEFISKHQVRYEFLAEDYIFWNRIFKANEYKDKTFYNIREVLILYNIHPNQETSIKGDQFSSFISDQKLHYFKDFCDFKNLEFSIQEEVNISFIERVERIFESPIFAEYDDNNVKDFKLWLTWSLLFKHNQENNLIRVFKIYQRNPTFGFFGYLRLLKKYLL